MMASISWLAFFANIIVVDFEFHSPPGEIPRVLCVAWHDLKTGKGGALWEDDLAKLRQAPFPSNETALVIGYYASAEMGSFLALGWPMPVHVLDLFTEFRVQTNQKLGVSKNGLFAAMAYFGLPCGSQLKKDAMRDRAIAGGIFSSAEQKEMLTYCQSDVEAECALCKKILPRVSLPHALLRGRYMKAAAVTENIGVPIDTPRLEVLLERWGDIQDTLIAAVDSQYGVYEGRTFKQERFVALLNRLGVSWPRHPTGSLDLREDTFREMAKRIPYLQPLRELRHSLSKFRLNELAVGKDGRNRTLLSAFQSKTGRNQPSNSKFIFGPSAWLRGLIRPEPGMALAYIDYEQQEFGIAAALSGDEDMQFAYSSGDPYLAFAIQAGAVPKEATKTSHPALREQFKQCVLAVQYGMGADSLAARIDQPTGRARELLQLHRRTYPTFWRWSQGAVDHASLLGSIETTLGWRLHIEREPKVPSLQNFPMQANGAEMLRLASCFATEAGIRVCAPVHDALLIEAAEDEVDEAVSHTQELMAEASSQILGGFRLRTDVKHVRHPERYMDPRGEKMWNTVWGILNREVS